MILYLIKQERYYRMVLPERIKGQYWLTDFDGHGNERKLLSVEAVGNDWMIKSNRRAVILNGENAIVKSTVIRPMSVLNIRIADDTNRVILFAEPVTPERGTYFKLMLRQGNSFRIGRDDSNDIVFHNEFVSSHHAVLEYDGKSWSISDRNSTNGTYVNGIRTVSRTLLPGDCIFIMGLKIVVGLNFFALNNPNNDVRLHTSGVQRFVPQPIRPFNGFSAGIGEDNYFFRSPRLKKEISRMELTIDQPPQPQKQDSTPLALVIGPSITMGMASMSMGIFSVVNVLSAGGRLTQALPMLIMSGSMLLGTVLWPILTRRFRKRQIARNEAKRQQKYLDYLGEIRDQIHIAAAHQAEILRESLVTWNECASRITERKSNLWERSAGQDDFLKLRLGIGMLPMEIEIHYQEKKFTLEDDNLQNAMLAIGTEDKMLRDVPIGVSLIEQFNMGVIGSYHLRMNLLKSLILQMVSLHGYDELKICLLCDESMLQEFGFVKCIRHFWDDEQNRRYLATTPEEARELSAELEREILPRSNVKTHERGEMNPYYVVIAASLKVAEQCEAFRKMLGFEENYSLSMISLGSELKELPKEIKTVIDLTEPEHCMMYEKDDISGRRTPFQLEKIQEDQLPQLGEELANIHLDLAGQNFALPDMLTFLEMFQVGKIEHLNSLTRWRENDPINTLQTPIGLGTAGETFMLDLHEKFHGPHGLVAGMTGSGKSEFIITYILSLAVNYHPDEVAFILIDYKGGGLAGAFEDEEKGIRLPHLAGTITNLDGAAVNRSLISIQSELRRRQSIFNEARKTANEGTMDIYSYQQLYRDGIVTEPVPHLFIISDEFAELKTQQPEFMEQLISAARIGRSLGVHLILATQKPSGVVDDQIWSNSKFRICLKVQEKADSQDMIKCPDAAELSQTGRFYLQVGFNELFALGQSAWCGAEYVPAETLEKSSDSSIQVVDNLGRVMMNVKPAPKKEKVRNRVKQVVGIVKYLSELAEEEKVGVRQLWLPPIPQHIYLEKIEEKYGFVPDSEDVNPVIGEYDDPYNQSQKPLQIPLSRDGNCLVYGAVGSGKGLFLTTLLYSLIKNYEPERMNIYIMDFGAETLRAFEQAPHVGGVALAAEEEKITNLLKLLHQEMARRRKLFADAGGDYQSYCRQTGEKVPHIVVVLNNYAVFREQYEDYESVFQTMTQDGLKYGVYFVVTAASTNAMRYTITQNFKTVMTMQLNDESEYSLIVGRTQGLYPMACAGRGLIRYDMPYEFQTAYCKETDDMLLYIRNYCEELTVQSEYAAAEIPVLPRVVDVAYVRRHAYSQETVPVGVSKKELKLCQLDLKSSYIYPVAAQDLENCRDFVLELVKVLQQLPVICEVWNGVEGLEQAVINCFDMMVERNNNYKDAGMNPEVLEACEERIWILYGVRDIFNRLSEDGQDKLHTLLEKGKAIYKTHFIIVDTVNGFNEFNYQNWYKEHITQSEGIWLGDGLADQYFLKVGKMSREYYEEIGSSYGYLLVHNKPTLMKVLSSEQEDEL